MDLEIKAISLCGKAFLYDWKSGKNYYMENASAEIREAEEVDYYPMNTQNMLLIHPLLYQGRTFKNIKDAQRFVSRTTYIQRIKELNAEMIDASSKYAKKLIQENIDIYKEKLENLN